MAENNIIKSKDGNTENSADVSRYLNSAPPTIFDEIIVFEVVSSSRLGDSPFVMHRVQRSTVETVLSFSYRGNAISDYTGKVRTKERDRKNAPKAKRLFAVAKFALCIFASPFIKNHLEYSNIFIFIYVCVNVKISSKDL